MERKPIHTADRSAANIRGQEGASEAAATPSPERLRKIERAIRKLPRFQREIFCAIRFDDLSYDEIAERTGLSAVEVERLFAKSLRNFMRQLDWKPKRRWQRR